MKLQRPKGTVDILPGESEKWQFVEATMRRVFATYRFSEIRTPLFEHYEVISRSVGDTTDIVTKERDSASCPLLCRKQKICARSSKTI